MPISLPVYSLSPSPTGPADIEEIAAVLFGREGAELEQRDGGIVGRAGSVTIELDSASGGIWAADSEHLWNPSQHPSLPPAKRAYATAADLLGRLKLLPAFTTRRPSSSPSSTPAGRCWPIARASGAPAAPSTSRRAMGSRCATRASRGSPSCSRWWAAAASSRCGWVTRAAHRLPGLVARCGQAEPVKAIDRREARARFDELTSHLEVRDVTSFLAYHSAPVGVEQALLTPVYVFGATVMVDDKPFPMRLVTLPATEHGPIAPKPEPQPERRRHPGRLNGAPARRPAAAGNPFEAGTSWIGQSGGLTGSQANAQGFVDGLAADGWLINFNWGDANAWESDWRRNDDTWVDAADFVFYTGHASLDGWVLSQP
jgi:hypothetical protein